MLYEKQQPNGFHILCLAKHLLATSRIKVNIKKGYFRILLCMIKPELQNVALHIQIIFVSSKLQYLNASPLLMYLVVGNPLTYVFRDPVAKFP